MTTIDTGAEPRSPAFPFAARLSRVFARIADAWAARALDRETLRALDRLTDRELDDIGLSRADVDALR